MRKPPRLASFLVRDENARAPRYVNGAASMFSYSEYKTYRDQNRIFSGLAAYYPFFSATLAGETSSVLLWRKPPRSGRLLRRNPVPSRGCRPGELPSRPPRHPHRPHGRPAQRITGFSQKCAPAFR